MAFLKMREIVVPVEPVTEWPETPFSGTIRSVYGPTARQRRLCQRDGHPKNRLITRFAIMDGVVGERVSCLRCKSCVESRTLPPTT